MSRPAKFHKHTRARTSLLPVLASASASPSFESEEAAAAVADEEER